MSNHNSRVRRHQFKTRQNNSNNLPNSMPQEPHKAGRQSPTYTPPSANPPKKNLRIPTRPVNSTNPSWSQQRQDNSYQAAPPKPQTNFQTKYQNGANLQVSKPPYPTEKQPSYRAATPSVNNIPERKSQKQLSFWKRPVVWIIGAIIVVVAISLSLYLWLQAPKKTANPIRNSKTEQVMAPKRHKKAKSKQKSNLAKDIAKEQNSLQADKKAVQPKARDWKNSGSYDDMKYDNDDFTIQLNNSSDGVKLIPDANNKPALFIEYTFTNKSKKPQKPADLVNQDIQLKQNDQLLSPTSPASDNNDAQNKLNSAQQEVAPGQKADVAMMYSIGDTKNTISMYFMDLKTHQLLNTNQPFKL